MRLHALCWAPCSWRAPVCNEDAAPSSPALVTHAHSALSRLIRSRAVLNFPDKLPAAGAAAPLQAPGPGETGVAALPWQERAAARQGASCGAGAAELGGSGAQQQAPAVTAAAASGPLASPPPADSAGWDSAALGSAADAGPAGRRPHVTAAAGDLGASAHGLMPQWPASGQQTSGTLLLPVGLHAAIPSTPQGPASAFGSPGGGHSSRLAALGRADGELDGGTAVTQETCTPRFAYVYWTGAKRKWRASVRKTIDGVSRTYNGNHHADEEAAARQADE